jgi:hypothetical protein
MTRAGSTNEYLLEIRRNVKNEVFWDFMPCWLVNSYHCFEDIQGLHLVYWTFKRYSNPITGLDRRWGFQEVEAPRFQDKVVRLSALCTGRLYPPPNIPGTHFYQRLNQPQGHSEARWIMSMKNSNDTIGNRTCDLPVCSTVPQPTAPPRDPSNI